MSLFLRIIFFGLTGVSAGMLAWPFTEILIRLQARFPNLLIFNAALGIAVGLFMGGVFGMSEGIISVSKAKMRAGAVAGLILGAAGGLAGFFAGQAALLHIGTRLFSSALSFRTVGLPVSRALGWGALGVLLGLTEGVRSASSHKIRNGFIGGLIGGILGGFCAEYLRVVSPESLYTRLLGLAVLGFCIGIFYGFIENRLAWASLLLLSGRFRGKEFPLTQRVTTVGGSEKTAVGVSGYEDMEDLHAEIKKEKQDFILTDAGTKTGTFVNDERVTKAKLKDGDVVRTGDAQFLFRKR